uniref:THO complex subunit 2 n=1 Tax=Schistocephalus solidus TaxID=70667 RepID=A0A183SXM5_SCHSO
LQQSKEDPDICISNLCDLFIRLIVGDGKIDILPKVLSELFRVFNNQEFHSKLADALWLIDCAMADVTDPGMKDRYTRVVTHCKSFVDVSLLMERLSDDTLEQISLITSRQKFQTRYVRTKTRLFFKQQKFNLLREESEGYAKLIVELSQPMGSMEQCITHIRSLIGYFDLDPNRVLDIILDACEIRRDLQGSFIELINLYHPDRVDMTHILSHKFHFYQGREESTPESLHQLAALLITMKMVDVDVLLAHLQPSDDAIQSGRLRSIREAKAYRPPPQTALGFSQVPSTAANAIPDNLDSVIGASGGGSVFSGNGLLGEPNRLLVGGAVGGQMDNDWVGEKSATVAAVSSAPLMAEQTGSGAVWSPARREGSETNEPSVSEDDIGEFQFINNQKLDLCAALVRSGDWKSAQQILDRFPGHWIGSHAPLNKAICDLIHFLVDPLYESTCPLPSCLMKCRKKPQTPELFATAPSAVPDLQPATDFQSLGRFVLPITGYLGPFLSHDVVLIVKLCRLCVPYVSALASRKASPDAVYQAIFNMLDESILPALNMVPANCCLAEDVWRLLRHLPYDHRYRLYGQWKHLSCQGEPVLLRKRTLILLRTKAIMKRLSKENVKQLGRHLGKLSHSNPGVLFDYVRLLTLKNETYLLSPLNVLQSIQMFTNLIGPVVDALKYVSSLGYDVLAFCLIEALASDRSKLDDVQKSQSLQALSNFTGLLCKKYQFDLAGILQYVLNQLKAGRSDDLLILREIIHQMSGLDTTEEMTEEQLEAVSGGELLLQEGGYYAQIRNARKNATRLKEALIEHQLVMPFLFLMAQQRDAILFLDDPNRHVKLAGRLYDQCQGTLVQFITFLSLQMTREEMQAQCLPLEQMMGEYYVPADTAFCLFRSIFNQRVARIFEATVEKAADGEKDLTVVSSSSAKATFVNACREVIADVAHSISPLYPPRIWDELGSTFFATFWCLESGDLLVPDAAYKRQQLQLRVQLNQIEANPEWTSAKKKREIERCQSLLARLLREHTARQTHVDRIRAWLLSERDTWFQTMSATKTDTITQFLQFCVYPRACFTASDALYAAQFIHILHQLKAARFSTLICLDRIFNDITLPISMCSEDEAHRYGRFLCAVLDLVMRWHSSEEIFSQECGQFPGFITVFRKGSEENTKADQLQYENYRHVVHKWHYRITKATVACLESGHYSQIRNALIVLTRILPHYPKITQFGSAVERRVNKLKEEEKDRRPDLKALAFSYAGLMRPRKAHWVCEEEFHAMDQKPATRTQRSAAAAAATASSNSNVVASSDAGNPATNSTSPSIEATRNVVSDSSRQNVSTQSPSTGTLAKQHTVTASYHKPSSSVKSYSTATTTTPTSQKRSNPPPHDGQASALDPGAAPSDETREAKYRRTMTVDSVPRAVAATKVPPVEEPKEVRRPMRKRSAGAAVAAAVPVSDGDLSNRSISSAGGGGGGGSSSGSSVALLQAAAPQPLQQQQQSQQIVRVSAPQSERGESSRGVHEDHPEDATVNAQSPALRFLVKCWPENHYQSSRGFAVISSQRFRLHRALEHDQILSSEPRCPESASSLLTADALSAIRSSPRVRYLSAAVPDDRFAWESENSNDWTSS